MIARVSGKLLSKDTAHAVIDVGGVGYAVQIPLTTFYELPDEGSPVALYTHTHVRQDAILLFGFMRRRDRDLFQLIISVSGFGPRLALNILSGISMEELSRAVLEGDVKRLTNIPGVGRKMSERLVFEMREKIGKLPLGEGDAPCRPGGDESLVRMRREAASALVNLGYRTALAEKAIEKVFRKGEPVPSLDVLLKESLRILAG
jgi:Holliday junction DNA helicase RuvA